MDLFPQVSPDGPSISRQESCSFCGSHEGLEVSKIQYWDLHSASLVYCKACSFFQLDPKLNLDDTEKGVIAYHRREQQAESNHENFRNKVRNFRKGLMLGYQLSRKYLKIESILEVGPGSGYFLAGLKRVYPKAEITVFDISQDILDFCQSEHGFNSIKGVFDEPLHIESGPYDLIIARDILEHVNRPNIFLDNVAHNLKPSGIFQFLTPNGFEDSWTHRVHHFRTKMPSSLLINHVNYFSGAILLKELKKRGLTPLEFFTFGLKGCLKGKGRSTAERWDQSQPLLEVSQFSEVSLPTRIDRVRADQLSYLKHLPLWMTYFICLWHHHSWLRLSPLKNRGHEISGLFVKSEI